MPALLKPLVLAAAAAAALGALPAQAADCSAARGCAAKFCHIENDIAAAQAQNNTRREAGLRKALAEARASCTDSRLQDSREAKVRDKQAEVAERESELKAARAKGKQDKIDKAQRKLDEARAEYDAALAELNR
ncbi:hypothetical protein A6B37_22110 [Achromobacter sp. HZ01]|jgi:hypothetical protein|uniref:DUF1090 domain-containing protein n=1 Tax=Achromobacter pulmonis TaxID=1389932 RepID=A0A2N8KCB6_9BURK|nr:MULTISPECIES: DUF1090 domain-containing protein [Achromobacter]PND31101.1 DUF1090 domain-containing protein [Achromobacter pulmonis]RAP61055.1 hypothetical protein A6B37_22110 [Achromobacter sp. HZ01]